MTHWHWDHEDEAPKLIESVRGLEIASIEVIAGDKEAHVTFVGGRKIRVFDAGQSCCESRYMRTDDNLHSLRGKTLASIEVKDGPRGAGDDGYGEPYGEHEIAFLEVMATDGDSVTFSFHNEHNGYYGGFGLAIEVAP